MTSKKSNLVPSVMQQKYEDIMSILKDFCQENLNAEYLEMSGYLCAALCRKRPSPLLKGKVNTWACGIIHAIGTVNFLFDPSQNPHMSGGELYDSFGISSSTGSSKSKEIRDMFGMVPFDPDWTLENYMDDNPMVWMVTVNGFAIDVRTAPREIQEEAFRKGIIPYIPGEKAAVQESGRQWLLNTEAKKTDKPVKDGKKTKKEEKKLSPQQALGGSLLYSRQGY